MISDKVKGYSESIVRLHDGNSFSDLSKFVSDKVFATDDPWFTEEKYSEVCERIDRNVGEIRNISFIDKLSQGEKILTLWRAQYSRSGKEVLWSIWFESDFSKVVGLHVGW